ncbi:tripartite tricarboxylate transporter substrate binding protein [Craterilacuibacter sp. RT1T]|uniref:Bug family tripartite tricarboxylate transporter substrate binding protein n=1 Tax=Craterilacuibacter sp. RT1T TaxID=2942211 RepID=UPI0020BFB5DA|nr:tripartite tricarboxylate transporter substrate binding protein [Craterilacuibacter sp. RT1T]MCL6264164.1 tripartite tricarboxylate transporter substrate binding protein [Craterilacuibacter sp. RT1T]
MQLKTLITSLMLALSPLAAHAEVEQMKIMAPANPGGGFDTVARTLGDALKAAGQAKNVIVENKAGAGGTIGMAQFINTDKGNPNALLIAGAVTVGSIETNKSPVNFSMVTPIARLMGEYNVLVVPADSPYRSLKELMAAYKAKPGSISMGGGSAGGIDHIMAALMSEKVGVDPDKLNYIPYAGGGEGKAAVLGGQISAYISGYGELADLIKAGKVRALALSADKKQADINVPTLKEQGVDVVLYNWRGVFGAPGISAAQKKQLGAMVQAAVQNPSWKDKAAKLEWLDLYQNAAQFTPFLDAEIKRTAQVVKKLKLGN